MSTGPILDLEALADALWPLLEDRVVASFPGQKGTGSPLPNPPLNLVVTGVTTTTVSLSWTAPAGGVTTTNLYRNGIKVQPGISGTTTVDTGLTPGTNYTYYVTAQNAVGEGSQSNQVIGSTGAVPNAPQNLVVTGTTNSTVSLSWTAPVGGAASSNLYRNGTKVQSGISGTATIDIGLAASTSYNYVVTGTNSFGEGPASNQVTGTTQSLSPTTKKWNPGYYGDGNVVLTSGGSLATVLPETNIVGSSPAGIHGYVVFLSWSAYETAQGVYNNALLDSIYNQLAGYAIPRRMAIILEVGAFTSTHPGVNDKSILPLYIQQNVATYGQAGWRITFATLTAAPAVGATSATLTSSWPAPSQTVSTRFGTGETKNVVYTQGSTSISFPAMIATQTSTTINFSVTTQPAGISGWWGGDGNGHTYAASLHRPNVMARYIAAINAMGAWGDSKPLYEATMIGENSFWIGANSTNGGGSGYTDTASTTQQLSLMDAGQASHPHTIFQYENTFMQTITPCQNLETPIVTKGCLPGQTDSRGLTYITGNGGTQLPTWGVSAWAGQLGSGSTATVTNWRGQGVPLFAEVQAPDLGAFGGVSGGTVSITFTAAPNAATSAVISSNGGYWPNGIGYNVRFSNNSQRNCNVADSKTFTWTGALATGLTNAGSVFEGGANGWTPQDIADAMRSPQGFTASHCCVAVIPDNATYVPIDRRWTQATTVFLASPLNHLAYPSNF